VRCPGSRSAVTLSLQRDLSQLLLWEPSLVPRMDYVQPLTYTFQGFLLLSQLCFSEHL
jgi:hypothetical protein